MPQLALPYPATDDNKGHVTHDTDNTHVRVTGTKARVAQLYSLDGQLLTTRPTANGAVTVSLAECKPGVYVLRLENDRSFKVIRK